jgi:hypothetical protein
LSGSRTTSRIQRSRTQSEFFFSTIWPKIAVSRIERRKRCVSQSRTVAGPSRLDQLLGRKREEGPPRPKDWIDKCQVLLLQS